MYMSERGASLLHLQSSMQKHAMGSFTTLHLSSGAFGFVVLARRLEDGSLCAVKFMQRGARITKYVSREFINHRYAALAFSASFLTKPNVF